MEEKKEKREFGSCPITLSHLFINGKAYQCRTVRDAYGNIVEETIVEKTGL